jgi:hypothetical protein
MFYGQVHEFPGFSQMIYWGLARVSRVFQMVYWLASAPRPIRVPARWRPRLAHNAHPHQLLRGWGSSGARDRGLRLALRPAHGPLGCGSSGSGVLLTLLANLPLGLHIALGLSPIDLRRWALLGHPLHAEVEEAPLPGRPVGLSHFRLPNGFTGPSSSFCGSEQPILLGP